MVNTCGPSGRLGEEGTSVNRRFFYTIAGVLLIGGIGVGLSIYRSTTRPVRRLPLVASSSMNPVRGGAISPDGQRLAYADVTGIHVKNIQTGRVETTDGGPERGTIASWFPDGANLLVNTSERAHTPAMWM